MPSFIPLTSRIATAASCCLQPCSGCILSCRHCLLTPAIKGANSTTRSKKSCLTCEPRSSSARIRPRDSWCCPSAGSLSGRWRGSTAAADSPRIGRTSIAQRSRFCASPQFGSCSENFVILTDVSGQTLKPHTLPCKVDVVRVMNVLNSSYFDPQQLSIAVGHIFESLAVGGLLIVGSNDAAGTEVRGGIYRKLSQGFQELAKSGADHDAHRTIMSFAATQRDGV